MLGEFDDYPLQSVPEEARTISPCRLGMTAFGSMSFLAQESMGAMISMQFGFLHLLLALAVSAVAIMLLSVPVVRVATRQHIDIDLISRGCGFGYLGASLSSFIYAGYICAFLAFESMIVLDMLRDLMGIPPGIGYFLFNTAAAVLAIFGIRAIAKFQNLTNAIWIVLYAIILIAFGQAIAGGGHGLPDASFSGFSAACLGGATGITLAFVTQTGEQVDYLRFSNASGQAASFFNLLGGIFWFLPVMANMAIGGIISFWLLAGMADSVSAAQPYLMFSYVLGSGGFPHNAVFAIVVIFVLLSQLKINVTNIYSGSLAWSNFSARVTHVFPGRAFWAVFNTLLAFVIIESEIVEMPLYIFSIISILGLSWYGVLFTDITVNRALGLRPRKILFKRSQVPDIDPVGVIAMALGVAAGIAAKMHPEDTLLSSNAHFVSLGVSMACTVVLAALLRGRQVQASVQDDPKSPGECCSCHRTFSPENLAWCPAKRSYICAECCSLEAGCYEQCKRGAAFSGSKGRLPLVANYFAIMGAFSLLLWGIAEVSFRRADISEQVVRTFRTVFLLTDLAVGIFYLMFLFVLQGRRKALMDLNLKNLALEEEAAKRQETQRQLVEARNKAVSANLAKNRYLSGISHELRTPLNTIIGYIQLLQRQSGTSQSQRRMLDIIRTSGGYLADLIEGLLDISRIEAGKLEIRDERVKLRAMVSQLGAYFAERAQRKGISFSVDGLERLPELVRSDGKRLRQILTNLFSNAVKYTVQGGVDVRISFRDEVMSMTVSDTGVGMTGEFMKRMFEPFERAKDPSCQNVPGTGLGLTITRLLVTVMGGGLGVKSEYGKGTEFKVKLKFRVCEDQSLNADEKAMAVKGYIAPAGKAYKVLEVDDNPDHCSLICGMLEPVGFKVECASTVKEALEAAERWRPDVILLDISLPDGTGWDILGCLRAMGHREPVVMVSAEAAEEHVPNDLRHSYNGYIIKPVGMAALFDMLGRLLGISYYSDCREGAARLQQGGVPAALPSMPLRLGDGEMEKVKAFLGIGFLGGVEQAVDRGLKAGTLDEAGADRIKGWILGADLASLRRWANGN